jgi:[ribosomal protein S5]-alanine N-acetyltransferase
LKNDRLALVELDETYLPELFEISYYDGLPAKSIAEAGMMLEKITNDYKRGDSISWAITDSLTDELMGTCGYYRGFANGIGEIGYILKEKGKGRGIMTEAVSLIVNFGFEVMELRQIIAVTKKQNYKSMAVLERNGFGNCEDFGDGYFKLIRKAGFNWFFIYLNYKTQSNGTYLHC